MSMNKAIETAIASIQRSGAKLDLSIQTVGLQAMAHFKEHGDIVYLNKLYLAMPKGSRRSALAVWFMAHSKAIVSTDKLTKELAPFSVDKEKTFDLEAAEAMQWHEAKQEPAIDEVFDVQKALASLLRRAAKSDKVSDRDTLDKLTALGKVGK